jgi:hypothetical protein
MRPSAALIFAAVVAGIFAIMMLLLPTQVLEGFGAPPHADGIVVARDVGSLYLGLSVLFFLARKWRGAALRGVLLVGILTQIMAMLTNALAIMSGEIGSAAWPGVGIHVIVAAVLAAGYARAPREADQAIAQHV